MIGRIFITSSGYDPEQGRHVKDPYLGNNPSLGACRPDIRRRVCPGDHIFTISGKVRDYPQFIMGGFEVAAKIHANDAYRLYPEHRLRKRSDGQLEGNIIVDPYGQQDELDSHDKFDQRIENYIVGKNAIALVTPEEIARGRAETLDVLCGVLGKRGSRPVDVIGRGGCKLTEKQVLELREWLASVKRAA